MKKMFIAVITALVLCLSPLTAWAAEVTYTGNVDDLKTAAIGGANGGTTGNKVSVFPGTDNNPLSSGNTVTVNGFDITHSGWILGAYGRTKASGNSVTLQNGTVNAIEGGESVDGSVENNNVFVTGGTVNAAIRGGYTEVTGKAAANNRVEVSDGDVKGPVFGGESTNVASGNEVVISGGIVSNSYLRRFGSRHWRFGSIFKPCNYFRRNHK